VFALLNRNAVCLRKNKVILSLAVWEDLLTDDFTEARKTSMLFIYMKGDPYQRLRGQEIAEQEITIGGANLSEVAYGWRDLNMLVSKSDQFDNAN